MQFRKATWVSFVGIGVLVLAAGCSSTPANGGDAGLDAKADTCGKCAPDTGVQNDAATCASGLTCEVCDTSSYTPTQLVAPTVAATQCAPADITAFVTACGATGNQTTCDNWQTTEGTSAPNCLACTFSMNTDAKWGVYVCDNVGCSINTGGCLDVAQSKVALEKQAGGAGSCGDLINASFGCQDFACGNCQGADFDTCTTAALAHECKTYDDPVQSATGPCAFLDDAGTNANACFAATDNDLTIITQLLCGTPP